MYHHAPHISKCLYKLVYIYISRNVKVGIYACSNDLEEMINQRFIETQKRNFRYKIKTKLQTIESQTWG